MSSTNNIYNIFSSKDLLTLSSIVQIGNETYNELIADKNSIFSHHYFNDTRGRMKTKMVQMACELESHSSNFPFLFSERKFSYNQTIPELKTKDGNAIIHIARTNNIDSLPYSSKYKRELSNNNSAIYRQLVFNEKGLIKEVPLYCILAFGGNKEPFSILQFPEPGFESIAETIDIPQLREIIESDSTSEFKRKKAILKKQFTEALRKEIESS